MKKLELVLYPDPLLSKKLEPVSDFDDSLKEEVRAMFQLMYASKGIGLAANQAGLDKRIIVMNLTGDAEQTDEELVLINPEIVEKSRETFMDEEGCLSFPDLKVDVERFSKVTFRAQDENGLQLVYEAEELFSRCFQHELDHIDGIVFVNRLEPATKATIQDRLQELEDSYRAGKA